MKGALKINTEDPQKGGVSFRISSSAQAKPASTAGFNILDYCGDNMGTKKNIDYRPPKLHTTGKKWYVEVYYRIPEELRKFYRNKRWERFKIYKDININRTHEYAQWLLKIVETGLEQGWSPFNKTQTADRIGKPKEKVWTIQQACLFFLQKWSGRGLDSTSMSKYERMVNRFLKWLEETNLQFEPAENITSDQVEKHLEQSKKSEKWANSTYNGERGFISTMFNFFVDKEIIPKKITPGVKLKAKVKKHKFYDERTYEKLKAILIQKDPYLYFACQCVYYLCIRSEKELQNLRVGNILPASKQVLLTVGKTGERHIPLVDEMKMLFEERKILDYPTEYYVFSVPSKNTFVADGKPGKEPFKSGFFSKRFSKIRKLAGLSSEYTIMGFRHTRAVHLKSDGAKDQEIQMLMGHTDFITTSKYLRDLGLQADVEEINRKTRKI